jgi:large subunit ribosomal protein L31
MKQKIHPKYYPNAKVTCSCGNSWTTGSTVEFIRTDVCSQCHPFFTGEQRIVDTAGQVDRFQKRMQRFQARRAEEDERAQQAERKQRESLLRQQVEALELSERVQKALAEAGLVRVGDVLARLQAGDSGLLAIEGIGPKAVEEIKERLAAFGLVTA